MKPLLVDARIAGNEDTPIFGPSASDRQSAECVRSRRPPRSPRLRDNRPAPRKAALAYLESGCLVMNCEKLAGSEKLAEGATPLAFTACGMAVGIPGKPTSSLDGPPCAPIHRTGFPQAPPPARAVAKWSMSSTAPMPFAPQQIPIVSRNRMVQNHAFDGLFLVLRFQPDFARNPPSVHLILTHAPRKNRTSVENNPGIAAAVSTVGGSLGGACGYLHARRSAS
jgi:hypothetical protein